MGINTHQLDIDMPTTDQEIEMFDVEKLKSLLPQGGKEAELTQLDIILEAIRYIDVLREKLINILPP